MNDNPPDGLTPEERKIIAGVLVVLAEKLTLLRPGWRQFTLNKQEGGRLHCLLMNKDDLNKH